MFDNYIQSNAWVAKRDILSHLNLADPCLEVAEDMYLYILFLSVTDFLFIPTQTANWHWRSKALENSMLSVPPDGWIVAHQRLLRRLKNVILRNGVKFESARIDSCQRLRKKEKNKENTYFIFPVKPSPIQSDFSLNPCKEGFHLVEAEGVWTSSEFAWFQGFMPDYSRLFDVGITFSVAPNSSGNTAQFVRILANGQVVFEGKVAPWVAITATKTITTQNPTNSILLVITCESKFDTKLVENSQDDRELGVFITSIHAISLSEPKNFRKECATEKRNTELIAEALKAKKEGKWNAVESLVNTIKKNIDHENIALSMAEEMIFSRLKNDINKNQKAR